MSNGRHSEILDIWLFKDKTSYDANAMRLFGSKPSTPYGYYSSADGALVMNIATHQFYRADPGTNYSQARYLCYYLQEKGLLRKFYHRFVADHQTDPTGYQTLKQTLAADDMVEFKKRWEAYVMTLRFQR